MLRLANGLGMAKKGKNGSKWRVIQPCAPKPLFESLLGLDWLGVFPVDSNFAIPHEPGLQIPNPLRGDILGPKDGSKKGRQRRTRMGEGGLSIPQNGTKHPPNSISNGEGDIETMSSIFLGGNPWDRF